jgi:hypothetical protein
MRPEVPSSILQRSRQKTATLDSRSSGTTTPCGSLTKHRQLCTGGPRSARRTSCDPRRRPQNRYLSNRKSGPSVRQTPANLPQISISVFVRNLVPCLPLSQSSPRHRTTANLSVIPLERGAVMPRRNSVCHNSGIVSGLKPTLCGCFVTHQMIESGFYLNGTHVDSPRLNTSHTDAMCRVAMFPV